MHKSKKILSLGAVGILPLLLSACSPTKQGVTLKPPTDPFFGLFYKIIGCPCQHCMEWMSGFVWSTSSTGMSIIVILCCVHIVVCPLMLRQQRTKSAYQEKQKILQPQLKMFQDAVKRAKTPEQQMAANNTMRKIYSANGTSKFPSMGVCPMLIQFPIFSGCYQAMSYSPVISHATFLCIQLGHSSFMFTILATCPTIMFSQFMLQGVPPEQRKAMQATAFQCPIKSLLFCK